MSVEDAVTFHQIKDILDLLLLAIDGLGPCGADFMAGETLPALADVKGDEAVYQRQRPGPADLQAVTAFLGRKTALRVEGVLGAEPWDSGLLHQRQRSGQPFIKTTSRIPSPSFTLNFWILKTRPSACSSLIMSFPLLSES